MFFRERWNDDRLQHNVSYPITMDWNYVRDIWVPDIFFYNAKTADYHDVTVLNAFMRLSGNGDIMLSQR